MGNKESKYLRNLWFALRGKDILERIDELKGEYDGVIADMREKHGNALAAARKSYENKLAEEVKGYQQLVENLRTRVTEAEKRTEQAEKQAEQVEQSLGKLMMAQDLLVKTNNALTDLACRMENGKVEALREFAQCLEWNNVMLRIAKCHISVLSRRDELEKRQHEKAKRRDNFNLD